MMRRTRKPGLVGRNLIFPDSSFGNLDRDDLVYILDMLNRGPRDVYAEPLIRLMTRLKECGDNLKKMMDGDPELVETIAEVCGSRSVPTTNRTANLMPEPFRERIQISERVPGMPGLYPKKFAAWVFHVGTLNPEWDKLAGPCARCGRFYLKKRASQKVYCSRICGNTATATARTVELRKDSRAEKLRRAQAVMKKWSTARTQEDWKAFVSKQHPDITPKFLTRYVNSGDLEAPRKAR